MWCIPPDQDGRFVARMASAEAKALSQLRKQTVEWVNADWKAHRKLRRFSGRGLARVGAEVGLRVLAHNLLALPAPASKIAASLALAGDASHATNTT